MTVNPRRFRAALGNSPGRLRLWSVVVAVLVVGTGVACLVAASSLRSSVDRIRDNHGPVLVASQRVLSSLAEADAAATASFLAAGAGDPEQLEAYAAALGEVTSGLEEIAALVGEDPEVHESIQQVSGDVTRYAGLV